MALYDPAADVPVLPLPNDLVLDGQSGLLAVPEGKTAAEEEFNVWLRTLDGFPESAAPGIEFSNGLQPSTVNAESVRVIDLSNPEAPSELPNPMPTFDAAKKRLVVGMKFQRGKRYAVAVVGRNAPGGLVGQNGEEVVGSPAFVLLRSKKSLVTCKDLSASDCHSATELIDDDASAVKLERARRTLAPALELLESRGISRLSLVSAFTFQTVKQPVVSFDPANKVVPFPNDLSMRDGKVNLPADVKDDAPTAETKVLLNQLDGFSTTASILTDSSDSVGAADARLDVASVKAEQFRLINLDNPAEPVPFTLAVTPYGNLDDVALKPSKPLRSRTRYAMIWTRGAKSSDGRLLNVSSAFALARLKNPVFAGGKSTLPSIDDATAADLETLRKDLAPAFAAADALGLKREDVLSACTFTTQTTSPGVLPLRARPAEWNLPTGLVGGPTRLLTLDVSILATIGSFSGQDLNSQLRWVKEGEFTSGNALDPNGSELDYTTMQSKPTDGAFTPSGLATPRQEVRRFTLAVPKTTKFPSGAIPIVIFHHGLGESRRNAALIANTFAREGFATLAIDAPFHGLRSYCQSNSECRGGSTCTAHRCTDDLMNTSDGYRVRTFPGFGNDPSETPEISGNGFVAPSNLFGSRDHFRQHVIDIAQLIRVAKDGTNGIGAIDVDDPSTQGVVEKLDTTQFRYVGQSLGGIMGAILTAAIPEISASTLNVPGASMTDVILDSQSFSSYRQPLDTYLTSRGSPPGSPGYRRFLDIARWVLDPADPQNFGRHLIAEPLANGPKKKVFVQWVRNDETVPNSTTELLLRSIEGQSDAARFKNRQYSSGGHAFLLNITTPSGGALAIQAQTEALEWVK